jgi:sn-glycerol 3-phosphate transport system permease protein
VRIAAPAISVKGRKSTTGYKKVLRVIKPYLYLLPIIAFGIAFVYYPFFKTFLYSFSIVNFKGQITGFAGLDNFKYMFGYKNFSTALRNSLILTAMTVPSTVLITLGMALLANKKRKLSGIYETMFTMPMAVSMSAISMIFKVMLNPTVGYVNYFLGINLGWFEDKKTAIYGILMLCVWMGLGFDYLLFLSALRGIPDELIEASTLDGAGFITKLLRIQFPLITPTVLYVACTDMVLAMMTAGPVMIITQGGPAQSTTTLIYLMFTAGYRSSNYSLASCISIITFILTLGLTLLAFIFERKGVHYS